MTPESIFSISYGKESGRGCKQCIKDERKNSSEGNLLQSCRFVVLFFFSADTVNMEGTGSVFFIGHMPLHNDLWMQGLCRLILLSMHYLDQPSMAI